MLFRLKKNCGSHVQNGKVYKSGDVIKTDRDLCAIFNTKFERVHEALKDTGVKEASKKPNIPLPVSKDVAVDVDEKEDEGVEGKEEQENLSDYGEDVTSEFPTAEKVEVKVFEKSKWFTVVDISDNSVLNEKKLRRKSVEPFLQQYLEADDDEDVDDED